MLTLPRKNPESATKLILFCLLATVAGCTRQRAGGTRAARVDAGPRIELPELQLPRPLPARRVLQLFHTSNAVAELDPCG